MEIRNNITASIEEKEGVVRYEIQMFRETCSRIACPSFNSLKQIERNLLIESLAIHTRVLMDFFYGSRKLDDIIAQDLLSENDNWEKLRLPITQTLEIAKRKANKQLAHLSLSRIEMKRKGKKSWEDFVEIWGDMEKVIKRFIKVKKLTDKHKEYCIFCDLIENDEFPEYQLIDKKDEFCIIILEKNQYTKGHTLVILKNRIKGNHIKDISDENFTNEEMAGFIKTIHMTSKTLKKNLKDDDGRPPERIYVSILCDGTKHLHAHLIPRYCFTEEEKSEYRNFFERRDGQKQVREDIKNNNIGGFWYMFIKERDFNMSSFGKKSETEKEEEFKKIIKEVKGEL
ncbi:MAG: HIT family protein [Candidatus Nealsonbacteria bacterium]